MASDAGAGDGCEHVPQKLPVFPVLPHFGQSHELCSAKAGQNSKELIKTRIVSTESGLRTDVFISIMFLSSLQMIYVIYERYLLVSDYKLSHIEYKRSRLTAS